MLGVLVGCDFEVGGMWFGVLCDGCFVVLINYCVLFDICVGVLICGKLVFDFFGGLLVVLFDYFV